jgi:hypothetical protein
MHDNAQDVPGVSDAFLIAEKDGFQDGSPTDPQNDFQNDFRGSWLPPQEQTPRRGGGAVPCCVPGSPRNNITG